MLVLVSALGKHLTLAVLQQEALSADFHSMRINFQNLRKGDKLVHELLSNHFLDDVLVIIVTESSAQLVIIHISFVFSESPQLGHLFCFE